MILEDNKWYYGTFVVSPTLTVIGFMYEGKMYIDPEKSVEVDVDDYHWEEAYRNKIIGKFFHDLNQDVETSYDMYMEHADERYPLQGKLELDGCDTSLWLRNRTDNGDLTTNLLLWSQDDGWSNGFYALAFEWLVEDKPETSDEPENSEASKSIVDWFDELIQHGNNELDKDKSNEEEKSDQPTDELQDETDDQLGVVEGLTREIEVRDAYIELLESLNREFMQGLAMAKLELDKFREDSL
jgi:hypothetical protein